MSLMHRKGDEEIGLLTRSWHEDLEAVSNKGMGGVARLIVPPIRARPEHRGGTQIRDDEEEGGTADSLLKERDRGEEEDGRISAPITTHSSDLPAVFITQKGITKL